MTTELFSIRAGQAVDLQDCPVVPFSRFRGELVAAVEGEARLSALPVWPAKDGSLNMMAVISCPTTGNLGIVACKLPESYPAITRDCTAAHWFEREIAEQWGVSPDGHPWLKPIRFEPPRRRRQGGQGAAGQAGVTDFFRLEGDEGHEVAVGPVHAGVIEPGHFRFACHGEDVYHLEISLGYQHRGIERALEGGPTPRSVHYMETLAGDTTVGHAVAYAAVMEALGGTTPPLRAEAVRAVAAELERIANHIGDLGALAGDVGYLPTMSYCGRLRGDVLNLTAELCGNRFGRGLVRPGGSVFDITAERAGMVLQRLDGIEKDLAGAVDLLFNAPSVLARFEGTGVLDAGLARSIGLVGVAARACGLPVDVRHEFAYGIYRFSGLPLATWGTGDCFARAYVRWIEIGQSLAFIRRQLQSMPEGACRQALGELAPNALAVGLVEGWRGEICHVAVTGEDARFSCYKVVDPSFHNWFGLACALRNQQISDFPLCNKSFNLSYCGHDL